MYKHDFICSSETYLDYSKPDGLLKIDGYKLVCAANRNNIKRVGVCIYYKESLRVCITSLTCFKEQLLLQMKCNKIKVIVSVIYVSLSHNYIEFDLFFSNFKKCFKQFM